MKEFEISEIEENQKIMTYLRKLLPGAQKGFLHRMFRKKNITLNGYKIKGIEVLKKNDCIQVFFAEATFEQFSKPFDATQKADKSAHPFHHELSILYEDEALLLIDKPAGILSQPNGKHINLVEDIEVYLAHETKDLIGFKPGICNRLDRNTTGIIISGKSVKALQALNHAMANRNIKKHYHSIALGVIDTPMDLKGYLVKDEQENKVKIKNKTTQYNIHTIVTPLRNNGIYTEVAIEILTGKPHQIRAHLASVGHPLIGDTKYGDHKTNLYFKKQFGLMHHLLHAERIEFTHMLPPLEGFSDQSFRAPLPVLFSQIQNSLFEKG